MRGPRPPSLLLLLLLLLLLQLIVIANVPTWQRARAAGTHAACSRRSGQWSAHEQQEFGGGHTLGATLEEGDCGRVGRVASAGRECGWSLPHTATNMAAGSLMKASRCSRAHHTSHVTRHTSHATRHTSHATRHTSPDNEKDNTDVGVVFDPFIHEKPHALAGGAGQRADREWRALCRRGEGKRDGEQRPEHDGEDDECGAEQSAAGGGSSLKYCRVEVGGEGGVFAEQGRHAAGKTAGREPKSYSGGAKGLREQEKAVTKPIFGVEMAGGSAPKP